MMYPPTYLTCFSAKNDDSSMWGNYADCHRGVCIEYETDQNNVFSTEKGAVLSRHVKPVVYSDERIERNFFETFGRLTIGEMKSWLTGSEGGISHSYRQFIDDEDEWRNEYWEIAEKKALHKMPEWSHEEEYRIAVIDTFMEFRDTKKEDRNVKFDLKTLKGIIFGLRTSEYDKMRIFKTIQDSGNFEEVTFYQAEYDDETRKIAIREKDWKKIMKILA